MTNIRRARPLMLAAIGGLSTFSAAVASAASPTVAKAPGRVVFSVNGGAVSNDADGGGARAGVSLPDGGSVLVGNGGSGGSFRTYVAKVKSDGSLDSAFGAGGIATLPGFAASQVLREADGSLVVAGNGATLNNMQLPPIVLAHLHPNGTIDSSFGANGLATLPVQSSCGDCAGVSVAPSGDLVVTGSTGHLPANPIGAPQATPDTQWVVARLTPNGAPDPSFGQAGIATLLPTGSFGTAVATQTNGDTVALGRLVSGGQTVSVLTRLLPSGAVDPSFDGGSLVAVPGGGVSGIIANDDGTVLVDTSSVVVRYTAAGLLDPSFGTGGVAAIAGFPASILPFPLPQSAIPQTQVLPAPGDSVVIFNVGNSGVVVGERLTPSGALDPTFGGPAAKQIALGFGGGGAGVLASVRPRPLPPLAQDSTDIRGTLVERADGSFLAVNGVSVIQPTGEGAGRSIFGFALAGLTPSFGPDPSFGGPATKLYAKLRAVKQRASTAHTRHGILVSMTMDQPGLARVVIKAHGRVVAQNVLPIFGHGQQTLPVELTTYGNQLLRTHSGVKITATATGRDLLTNTARSTASGILR
jgi:uncharacterized delta-60 repeat protein